MITPFQIRWREFEKRETLRLALRADPPPSRELVALVRSAKQSQRWVPVRTRRR